MYCPETRYVIAFKTPELMAAWMGRMSPKDGEGEPEDEDLKQIMVWQRQVRDKPREPPEQSQRATRAATVPQPERA